MSKKIPQDVEQLMWLIAESGDSNAAQEFERRFPDFRFELMRRMSTVKSLKASKPNYRVPVPEFSPARPATSNHSRAVFVGAFALGLGVLAFGSYAVTQRMMPPKEKPKPAIVQQPPVSMNSPVVSGPNFTKNPPGVSAVPAGETGGVHDGRQQAPWNDPSIPKLTDQDQKALQAYSKPQDINVENAPLRTVIELIASSSGLSVTFMPNANAGPAVDFDKTVSVDYKQMSGLDMLRKLGQEHGFTPMYQGKNEFMIIPSVTNRPILGD